MKFTQFLDYFKTLDKQAVRVRKLLRELYSDIHQKYEGQFRRDISGFCFAEIDDTSLGERLSIRENRFFGKPVVEVDVTHSPDTYDRNRIIVRQEGPIVATIEQFLTSHNIPYQLRREGV